MNIRKYNKSDFELIASWWKQLDKKLSNLAYPEESSYVLEIDGIPYACASLYLMNTPIACMIENLISDSNRKIENKQEYINKFINFLEKTAKEQGYISIIGMTYIDKLKDKYTSIGYKKIADNLTVFAKSLKDV